MSFFNSGPLQDVNKEKAPGLLPTEVPAAAAETGVGTGDGNIWPVSSESLNIPKSHHSFTPAKFGVNQERERVGITQDLEFLQSCEFIQIITTHLHMSFH